VAAIIGSGGDDLKFECRREGGLACEAIGRGFIKAACHGRRVWELRQVPELYRKLGGEVCHECSD
jgi:hypothetical protein